MLPLLLGLGGAAAFGAATRTARRPAFQTLTRRGHGLAGPVDILRDRWGVPHIYATDAHDLVFAQGYVHAQDRLWQMEANRRLAAGRLAEIFGARGFAIDRLVRTIGFSRAAAEDEAHLDRATLDALAAYADGVNAAVAAEPERLPAEFRLLAFRPEPWRPLDTLCWAKVMAWMLSINWASEVMHLALIERMGPARAARLRGDYPDTHPLVVPENTLGEIFGQVLRQFEAAEAWLPQNDNPLPMGGLTGMSNNWVIDGVKSTTGRPLLANDPHLTALQPGMWYENHLVGPGMEVTGVSMAGCPGVVIGHNAHLAWGMTAAFADTQDLYIEKPHPQDRTRFEYQGQWEQATVVHEMVQVRGERAPRQVDVTITRHGPIVNELARLTGRPNTTPLALRWTAYEPGRLPAAVLSLNRAANWDEFCTALADWHEPALNFVYADRAGNIGYYMAGRVPRRPRALGLVPSPGWTGEDEWQGWVPHDELPHALNPAQHYFASANNQVVGQEYPHFLSAETSNGYRARRIVQMLEAQPKLGPDDFAAMQQDVYCGPAEIFCRLLVDLAPDILAQPALQGVRPLAAQALSVLAGWDYRLTVDSVGGTIFEVTQYYALRRVFEPWLGALTGHYLGMGFDRVLEPAMWPYVDRAPVVLAEILTGDESAWFRGPDACGDTAPLTRQAVLALALGDALTYLRRRLGPDIGRWQWGAIHRIGFHHMLGMVRPLSRVFSRGPIPYGGDANTVCQAGFLPTLPIRSESVIASWRQIIDVGDWDAARGILPTGNSGRPGSRHYDDMLPLWLRGEYHPLLWSRARVEAATTEHLRLQ